MLDNFWHKKERPFLGLTGMGGGVGSNLVAGGAGVPGMKATGGILHEYTDPGPGTKYRCHVFLQPGSLAVTEADGAVGTMDYLVVGGGGGASGNNGGGGGGGGVYTGSQTIAALTYPVTVGAGGKGTFTGANPGSAGNSDAPVSNALQGAPSYFTDPSGPTTRTAGGGGGSLAWCQHISVGTLAGLSPGGSGGGAGLSSPGPGGDGNNSPGALPGGGGGAQNGGGGGANGTAGNAGNQPNSRANGGDGYASTILGPYITSPAGGGYWGGGGGGCSKSTNGSGSDYKGGVGGAGGGGTGSGDSPGGGPGERSEYALNWGWYARCDPGGSPRGNNGGDGGVGTGGGGGGGGRGRNATNQPNMVGPRNYNPTWQWNNGGGDGGPGCVIFKYALPAEYDLDYTKATGGLTHKVQDPTAADDGTVYHVMIDGCYGGTGPNQKANICDDNDCKTFTVGPTSFNAHIVMVGGGGGAGAADAPNHWSGGGGGGGLVLENPALPLTASMVCKYSVGHFGRGSGSNPSANSPTQWATRGARGDCTVFGNRTSPTNVQYHYAGGGGGGGIDLGGGGAPGEPVPGTVSNTDGGGSGGGAAGSAAPGAQYSIPGPAGKPGSGATSTPTIGNGTWVSYANDGAWSRGPESPGGPGTSAGGGGGAGGAGGIADPDAAGGGAGGAAKAMPAVPNRLGVGTPGPVSGVAYFAGGGGGGGGGNSGTDSGGAGGGAGAGGVKTGNSAAAMIARTAQMTTGSGGGGAGSPAFGFGGPGGSGCIIIKYPSS